MRLLAELRRRRVLHVAGVYLVVAWMIAQVMDTVFEPLHIPGWTQTLVLVLLILGFPAVLALSWAFEITSEGVVRDTPVSPAGRKSLRLFLLVSTLTIALAVGAWYLFLVRAPTPEESVASEPSIAILPFRNLSPDDTDRYFAEGVAEEILNSLLSLPGLRVVGHTSSFAYGRGNHDLREIGDKLDAGYVLEGSVRRSGEQLRITAQLSETASGFGLWASTYNARLEDIFSVQEQISSAIVDALNLKLVPQQSENLGRLSTYNLEAYDTYLRARSVLREAVSVEAYEHARELFDRSLAIDPAFAEAVAGKCEAIYRTYEETHDTDILDRALPVCNHAAELNERSPQVQIALGSLYLGTGRAEDALAAFTRGVEYAPVFDDAYRGRGRTLAALGRVEEAIDDLQQAISLRPEAARNHEALATILYRDGDMEGAIDGFRNAVELGPDNPDYRNSLGGLLLIRGDFTEASEQLKASIDIRPNARAYSNAASALYYAGDYAGSIDMYRKAVELMPKYHVLYGNLGDACRVSRSCDNPAQYYEEALRLVGTQLEVNPDDAENLSRKGVYLAHLGKIEEAEIALGDALALGNDNLNVIWDAAVVMRVAGEIARSEAYIEQARELGYPVAMLEADPDIGRSSGDRLDSL